MEQRVLGRTGAAISVLGFGCGAVGGLMVRGAPADQERAVGRALESGINYFDTAPSYGNGASEENLGRVLKSLKPEIFLSTKFTVLPEHRKNLAEGIARSLEQSLSRLGRDHVDLLQLHNRIASSGSDRPVDAATVLQQVVPALEDLRRQGKIRFFGITALGDTPALHQVVDAGVFDTAQICHNLLNPSATAALPANFPAQDFERLAVRAHAGGMGTIGIRVLAGGAERARDAPSHRRPLRRADRLGAGLPHGCGAGPCVPGAGGRGIRAQPDRGGAALRFRKRGHDDGAGGHVDPRPARDRDCLRQQGAADARRARRGNAALAQPRGRAGLNMAICH